MQALPRDGAMASIRADLGAVARAVEPFAADVSIAAVNGPEQVVIAGKQAVVREICAAFEHSTALTVSHAFHSPLLDPMLAAFEEVVAQIELAPPRLPLISNLSGQQAGMEVTTPAYWRDHARHAVRFADGMAALAALEIDAYVEVGPRPILLGLGAGCLPDAPATWLPSLRPSGSVMLESLGRLYCQGAAIDFRALHAPAARQRVSLPTYAFQRQRYWIEGPVAVQSEATPAPSTLARRLQAASPNERPALLRPWLQALVAEILGVTDAASIGMSTRFLALGLDSLMAVELRNRLRTELGLALPVTIAFTHPTIDALTTCVLDGYSPEKSNAAAPSSATAWPLSVGQKALWYLYQLAPDSAAYNVPVAYRIFGSLDPAVLRQALLALVRRHGVLRTRYGVLDGQPIQRLGSADDLRFDEVEAAGWSEAVLEQQLKAAAAAPFDLAVGPALRVVIYRRSPGEAVLLLVLHHIVMDGSSLPVLLEDLGLLLAAGESALSPAAQYGDFVHWQAALLASATGDALWQFWKGRLAGAEGVLNLPLDRPRPPVRSYRGASHGFALGEPLTTRLQELARAADVTPYALLLTALQVVLQRYTGQDDIVVGAIASGRTNPDFERVVGYMVNPLPLRTNLAGDPTFLDLLQRVQQAHVEALTHQDFPFPLMVERLQLPRDPSRSPLYQASLVMYTRHLGATRLQLGGWTLEPIPLPTGEGVGDLHLSVTERGAEYHAELQYNTDLFEPASIARLAEHLRTLLAGGVATPEARLSALPMITPFESELLASWRQPAAEAPYRSMCELIAMHAGRSPATVAVSFEGHTLTYRELDDQANRLARHLRTLGVGPEQLVGVCLERSPELVVALLAVWKAGGAYVPLDPTYPAERLAFLLADSGCGVLLASQDTLERLPPYAGPVVRLDADHATIEAYPATDPGREPGPRDLAYVIYTSGSTGQPNGVQIEHGSLSSHIQHYARSAGYFPGCRTLQFASFSFDSSVEELFCTLYVGGTLVLARKPALLPGPPLARTLREEAISLVMLPPAALAVLDVEPFPDLQVLITAGEACSQALVDRWAPGRRFVNAYGPTEATVGVTFNQCFAGEARPVIGRPNRNVQAYVLDERRRPVPIGVPGELYVGGSKVARGYLNRPELTAERFIANPFGEGRLYKTGDRVRWLPDGRLDFLGRIDHQVKLRGFRIELGEIEHQLRQHPAVKDAAVVIREDRPGDKRLVAYVTGTPDVAELRARLKRLLPEFMVPAHFVPLPHLPVTSNGKLDRRALPQPQAEPMGAGARTPTEARLAAVWAEVLGLNDVGVEDDYFALGGHSLLVVRLMAGVRDAFGCDLPLGTVLEYPTVARMAALLDQPARAMSLLVPLKAGEATRAPLFLVHPSGGSVFPYRELAAALPEGQPVYGLQSPALDGKTEPFREIEAMARHYLQALRAVQPHGPYHLGGHSSGGSVAYEMAQQLAAAGERVESLFLCDAFAPDRRPPTDEAALAGRFAAWRQTLPNLPTDDGPLQRIMLADVEALQAYVPRPYNGRIVYCRASETVADFPARPDEGWHALAQGEWIVHTVPGNHWTMLQGPHVAGLLAAAMPEPLRGDAPKG
jgi:amino acid adenylation domain-containing protein